MREFLISGLKEIGVEYTEKKVDNLLKYLSLFWEQGLQMTYRFPP